MPKSIGKTVRDARNKAKLTQERVSEITGLSRSYICDIENNRYTPSVRAMSILAKTLNIDLNFLAAMTEIHECS